MDSVVRRKKKTLIGRIATKVKTTISPSSQSYIAHDVPLCDIRICIDEVMVIEMMRHELRTAEYNDSDVIICVDESK